MYQKSPFPYLFILIGIITISCFTNLTLDKEIEEPIVYKVEKAEQKISNALAKLKLKKHENITSNK